MRLTEEQFPAVWGICIMVLADSGALSREEGVPVAMTIPADHVFNMRDADSALARLSVEERETFAYGEYTEQLAIASRNRHLAWLSCVLALWFQDGMPCERTS